MDGRRPVVTFVVALLVLALVLYAVGIEAVVSRLQQADPLLFLASLLCSLGAIGARLVTTALVFQDVEGSPETDRLALVFFSGGFLRSVLPWGRTSGAPLYAYLFATESDANFEDSLAGIAVVDLLGTLASAIVVVAAVVALFWSRRANGGVTETTTLLALASLLGLITLLVVASLVWLGRETVTTATVRVVGGLQPLGKYSRRMTGVLNPESIRGRVEGFFSGVRAVVDDRGTLVVGLGLLVAGWLFAAAALSASMAAVGVGVPLHLSLFAISVAGAASAIPLPGGIGTVEAALASLLAFVTVANADATAAAALLYRLGSFWLLLSVGAVCTVVLFGRLFPGSVPTVELKE